MDHKFVFVYSVDSRQAMRARGRVRHLGSVLPVLLIGGGVMVGGSCQN